MGIIKRLKNLWHISSVELPHNKKETKSFVKKMFSQHAIIVETKNPIEELKLD